MAIKRLAESFFILIVLSLICQPTVSQTISTDKLEARIDQVREESGIPGLAVVIIKDDSLVLMRGFGMRRIGEKKPVDDLTCFVIGSLTKAFTSAAVAILVDEGKLGWDDPVIKHLPDFKLADPCVTKEITIRDLLSARVELENANSIRGKEISRDEVIKGMQNCRVINFRAAVGSGAISLMYATTGKVVSVVSGKTWDEFIKAKIFEPLGMRSSVTNLAPILKAANVVAPHKKIEDKIHPINWVNYDNIGPAAAINSNILDMGKWIAFQLKEGEDDSGIISGKAMKELHCPQIVVRDENLINRYYPQAHFVTYGLGGDLR